MRAVDGSKDEGERRWTTNYTHAQWKQYCDTLEKELPDLWRKLYPRIYQSPPKCGEYYSARDPAHMFLQQLYFRGQAKRLKQHDDDNESRTDADSILVMADLLQEYAMPQIWLGHDMAEAIKQTTPPMDLNWTTMKLPFPAMIFMLPKGSLVHPKDGNVRFLAYARMIVGDAPGGTPLRVMWFVTFTETGSITVCGFKSELTPIIPLGNVPRFHSEFSDEMERQLSINPAAPQNTEYYDLQKEALHLIFGGLLMMSARPSLVSEPQLLKRVSKKLETPKEFWSCRILGEHFKIHRETLDRGGTHMSPRLHWVMGHWREQACGAGYQQHKLLWIEPFTRGGDVLP
jgi:hypothetical protein